MIAAVVASVGLMMLFAKSIGEFVSNHPTIKMLALSFLVVVGVVLIADGFGHHVPKGYIYFAMAFSVGVEMLNIRLRKKAAKPVDLREPYARELNPTEDHTGDSTAATRPGSMRIERSSQRAVLSCSEPSSRRTWTGLLREIGAHHLGDCLAGHRFVLAGMPAD